MGIAWLSLDYLLFLNGFAWLLLIAPAARTARIEPDSGWRWLMCFAAVCSAAAWAKMLLVDIGDHTALVVLRYLLQCAAIFLLGEFSRRMLAKSSFRAVAKAVHAVTFGSAFVAVFFGQVDTAVALVSVAGPAACACASFALLAKSRASAADRRTSLRLLSTGFGALAITLSLRSALDHFFPAHANQLFYSKNDLAVQLARLASVACISVPAALQFNRQYLRPLFTENRSWPVRREISWAGSALLVVLLGWFCTENVARREDSEMRKRVISRMRVAAAAMGTEGMARLCNLAPEQNSESFERFHRVMNSLTTANPDVRFASLRHVQGERVRTLVDSERVAWTGDAVNQPPKGDPPRGYIAGVAKGKPFVLGPFTDHRGNWVSGSYPLINLGTEQGWVSLDLDFTATHWYARILRSRVPPVLITLLVSGLLVTSFRAQWRIREGVLELGRSEQKNTSLVEGSPNWVQLVDPDGRCISVNRNGLTILGRTRENVVDARYQDLWPPSAWPSIDAAMKQTSSGAPATVEAEYVRPDGRTVIFRLSLSQVAGADSKARDIVCIGVDITDRKRYELALCAAKENAEAAARAKSDFLAVMSHEIRTPLGGVIGMLELLRKMPQPSQQRHYTILAHDSAERLLDILDDVLDAAKIEAGRLTLETIPFQIRQDLGRLVECMRVRADAKGLELTCEFDPSVPEFLKGDPTRLRQALANLINNAIKFTPVGAIHVAVTKLSAGPEGIGLRIAVSDTGVGISAEAQARLFTKFVQADTTTTRRFGGTGLGLAITKHIAELMHGSISVESCVGKGSTFAIKVRLGIPYPQEISALAAEADVELPRHAARLKVLCADDEMINRVVAEGMLTRMGHAVDFAEDGLATIEMLSNGDYDVVLMDNRMPRMDGLQATRAIRNLNSAVRDHEIFVIAATANSADEHRQDCLSAGMDDFLSKPLREAELHAVLTRAIQSLERRSRKLAKPSAADPAPSVADDELAPGLSEDELFAMLDQPASVAVKAPTRPPMIPPEIARQYLRDAPRRLEQIRDALTTKDNDAMGIAAHSLKNISHYVSAARLCELGAAIEKAADANSLEGLETLVIEAEAELASVKLRLETHPPFPHESTPR
jgi:PAS domain S-box-containing protein